jgi:nucleoside-triphosphatase
MGSVFLVTGNSGTGKTTVIRKTLSQIQIRSGGFYTEEIRLSGIREGFKIITLNGVEAILAHIDLHDRPHIGKYGVNLENLENVAVKSILEASEEAELVVIDEIGKMEMLSPNFRKAVLRAINSGKRILSSIMLKPHPFADRIKNLPGAQLIEINLNNREHVLQHLVRELRH